jgi:hypothetical protein
MYKLFGFIALILGFGIFMTFSPLKAQEIKHPEMETIFNDKGEEIVVIVATQMPPDPNLYTIKEEEGPKGPILVVYYKPTGDMVTLFGKTTIKGKIEGPGVSLFVQRVPPQIEKVIGQKSYLHDIKKRYLELIMIEKYELLNPDRVDLGEIDQIIKRKRN